MIADEIVVEIMGQCAPSRAHTSTNRGNDIVADDSSSSTEESSEDEEPEIRFVFTLILIICHMK